MYYQPQLFIWSPQLQTDNQVFDTTARTRLLPDLWYQFRLEVNLIDKKGWYQNVLCLFSVLFILIVCLKWKTLSELDLNFKTESNVCNIDLHESVISGFKQVKTPTLYFKQDGADSRFGVVDNVIVQYQIGPTRILCPRFFCTSAKPLLKRLARFRFLTKYLFLNSSANVDSD